MQGPNGPPPGIRTQNQWIKSPFGWVCFVYQFQILVVFLPVVSLIPSVLLFKWDVRWDENKVGEY